MKDFNINDVFCEIIGGLVFLLIIPPLLSICNSHYSLPNTYIFFIQHLKLFNIVFLFTIAYVFGLMIDCVGLAIGELFLDKLIIKDDVTFMNKNDLWKNVSEHVLRYRERQWDFYCCYRNIFILLIPNFIIWTIACKPIVGLSWLCYGIPTLVIFYGCLLMTMKALLRLYNEIAKSFS
jgi:hypothetical protein